MEGSQREKLIATFMGNHVSVVVDRPVGYRHGNVVYPVNYGYIPDVLAGDGEEIDAYILGVAEPLETFEGIVIAVVCRDDDVEDKLVVAPEGMVLHQAQIREAVQFQEQYFKSYIVTAVRRSCGVIPYRYRNGIKEYLIILQTNGCWSFPKGHIEPGETEQQTALRELMEETGLTADLQDVRIMSQYPIPPYITKQLVLFPGEVSGEIRLRKSEAVACKWVRTAELKDYLHPNTWDACEEFTWGNGAYDLALSEEA